MKTTGKTNEGNFIVEMTPHEFIAMSNLSQVIEGKELDYLHRREDPGLAPDLTTVLGAILNFVSGKNLINQMKNKLEDIDNLLMDKGEKSEGDNMLDFFKGD